MQTRRTEQSFELQNRQALCEHNYEMQRRVCCSCVFGSVFLTGLASKRIRRLLIDLLIRAVSPLWTSYGSTTLPLLISTCRSVRRLPFWGFWPRCKPNGSSCPRSSGRSSWGSTRERRRSDSHAKASEFGESTRWLTQRAPFQLVREKRESTASRRALQMPAVKHGAKRRGNCLKLNHHSCLPRLWG